MEPRAASAVLDITQLPLTLMWVAAAVSLAVLTAVLFWIMPPVQRTKAPGRSVILGMSVFVVSALLARDPRGDLWFAATVPLTLVPGLVYLGPLPPDMPPSWDPACVLHPEYDRVAARGRRVGVAYAVSFAVLMLGSFTLVKGL